MNQNTPAELAALAQTGDLNALEQFLLWAYTPVSYLCERLLKDAAWEQTEAVLRKLLQQLPTLPEPERAEQWVAEQTAAWCISFQQNNRTEQDGRQDILPIEGLELDELQTVEAVERMVDMLPEKPRTCMTLLCCCGMKSAAIAQLTGFSVEEVRESMGVAQNFVLEQLQLYQEQGTRFYPISSLAEVLQSGMHREQEGAATAVVDQILGKDPPQPKKSAGWIKVLLWVLVVVFLVIDLLLAGLNVLVKQKNTFDPNEFAVPPAVSESTPSAEN